MGKAPELQSQEEEARIPAMFLAPAISLTGVMIETSGRNVATLWYFVTFFFFFFNDLQLSCIPCEVKQKSADSPHPSQHVTSLAVRIHTHSCLTCWQHLPAECALFQ